MATTTSVQSESLNSQSTSTPPPPRKKTTIVKVEEVRQTPGLPSSPEGERPPLCEPNHINQLSPQSLGRLSLQLETSHKEKTRSRTSILSDLGSTVARRRTYSGPIYSRLPSAEVKGHSRFSTGSVTSLQTLDTYCTATSYMGSWHTAPSILDGDAKASQGSLLRRTFKRLLQLNDLPSLVEEEQAYDKFEYDWCGRGMHVDFVLGEKVPLEICDSAGHGSTASVDIVKCRRIKLARKTTYLTPRSDLKVLLKEVQALQKLRHAHVVQLIGTYRQGRRFAALLYPVADMDLAVYLEEARDISYAYLGRPGTASHQQTHQAFISHGSLCLISALRYVHESGVKHMDIKPANILLKQCKPAEAIIQGIAYKLYLCDFGIAQANIAEESQTETYPGKTPMYASPEVAAYGVHGRASDVFSLGCVLLEMATVYSGLTVQSLKNQIRAGSANNYSGSYYANLDQVRSWASTLEDTKVSKAVLLEMLQELPEHRPSLVKKIGESKIIDLKCLHDHDPPELFEADPEEPEESDGEAELLSPEGEINGVPLRVGMAW